MESLRLKFVEIFDIVINDIDKYYQPYQVFINKPKAQRDNNERYHNLIEQTKQLCSEKINNKSFNIKVGFYNRTVYYISTNETEINNLLLDKDTLKTIDKYFHSNDLVVKIQTPLIFSTILFNEYEQFKNHLIDVKYDVLKIQSSDALFKLPRDITELDASNLTFNKKQLEELKKLDNIEKLTITNSDLSTLEYYGKHLRYLDVRNNPKLFTIKTNHFLTYLDVYNTGINNVSFYTSLETLKCSITMYRILFSNLEIFKNLKKVEFDSKHRIEDDIDITSTKIEHLKFNTDSDIKVVGNLLSLETIGLGRPIVLCTRLQSYRSISHSLNFKRLTSCIESLIHLTATAKYIYDINMLNEFTNLKYLSLSFISPIELSLNGLNKLEEIKLSNVKCTSQMFRTVNLLTKLSISNTVIEGHSLDGLNKVNELDLNDIENKLDDDIFLDLINLKIMRLDNVMFKDMKKNHFTTQNMLTHLEYENIKYDDYVGEYDNTEELDKEVYPINIQIKSLRTLTLSSSEDIQISNNLFKQMPLLESLHMTIPNIRSIESNSIKSLILDFNHCTIHDLKLKLPKLEYCNLTGNIKLFKKFFKHIFNITDLELNYITIEQEDIFNQLYLLNSLTLIECQCSNTFVSNMLDTNKHLEIKKIDKPI